LRFNSVQCWKAVFSPDGQRILTTSGDRTVRLWDLTGRTLAQFPGERAGFNPDGRYVLTVSGGSSAELRDLNGTLITAFGQESDRIGSAIFSPDGQFVLTQSSYSPSLLWDLKGIVHARFAGSNAIFSPDGQYILTVSDRTVEVWNRSGEVLATISGHSERIVQAIFSPDGKRILTDSLDGTTRLWDLDGHLFSSLEHQVGISSDSQLSVLSTDGQRLLTSHDGLVELWDVQGKLLATSARTARYAEAIFGPDQRSILIRSDENETAWLWMPDTDTVIPFTDHVGPLSVAVFSRDGQYIVTGSSGGTVQLWSRVETDNLPGSTRRNNNRENWESVARQLEARGEFTLSAYIDHQDPAKSRILTAASDGTVRLWNLGPQLLTTFKGHTARVTSARLTNDEQHVFTVSDDGTARLWRVTDQQSAVFVNSGSAIRDAILSEDEQHVLTISEKGSVLLWSTTGKIVATLSSSTPVERADFIPNGQYILTLSRDGHGQLWDDSGQFLANLEGSIGGNVNAIAFNPDGQHMIAGSSDGTAVIWDRQGRLQAKLVGHTDRISDMFVNPNGQHFFTVSHDRTARLWDWSGRSLAVLRAILFK
jgi:WD40 repeat protein